MKNMHKSILQHMLYVAVAVAAVQLPAASALADTVMAWGFGYHNQTGNRPFSYSNVPVEVPGLSASPPSGRDVITA